MPGDRSCVRVLVRHTLASAGESNLGQENGGSRTKGKRKSEDGGSHQSVARGFNIRTSLFIVLLCSCADARTVRNLVNFDFIKLGPVALSHSCFSSPHRPKRKTVS